METSSISEGEVARLSLFDPEGDYPITKDGLRSTSKNSMYIGKKGKGQVYGTVIDQQVFLKKA